MLQKTEGLDKGLHSNMIVPFCPLFTACRRIDSLPELAGPLVSQKDVLEVKFSIFSSHPRN